MSIADLVAFFAIAPFHRKAVMDNKELERLQAWINKIEENDEIMAGMQELKLVSSTEGAKSRLINAKL